MSHFLRKYGVLVVASCLTLSAILLFNACKKSKQNPSTSDILRTGKWMLSSGTVTVRNPNGKDTVLNYLKFIPVCYADDYLVFDSLNYGRRYTGAVTCSPADPSYFAFSWELTSNNTRMNLYNGFDNIYGIVDTVQPFYNDTISNNPYLVYDTIIGALDTPYPPKIFLELDTIRKLVFSGVPAPNGNSISNADIVNISQSSFTLHFQMISYYNDSTKWHSATYLLPLDSGSDPSMNPDSFAVTRPDTFNYSLTYTNF